MKYLRQFWPKRQRAFTLIEMVIVVAIIATLVLLISPNLLAQKDMPISGLTMLLPRPFRPRWNYMKKIRARSRPLSRKWWMPTT